MKKAEAKIKNFLSQYFDTDDLQEHENIFALGFVNSMFAMQLVLFIEKEFQVSIENEDLDIENFSTINAMVSLLESKKAVVVGN